MFKVDAQLFRQGMYNELKTLPVPVIGFAVAFAVNVIGHRLLKPKEENNYASLGIKLVAFAAGTAASIYTNRLIPVRVFTGKETWELARVIIPVGLVISFIVVSLGLKAPTIPAVTGGLIGMAGQVVPRSLGVIGAAVGAAL